MEKRDGWMVERDSAPKAKKKVAMCATDMKEKGDQQDFTLWWTNFGLMFAVAMQLLKLQSWNETELINARLDRKENTYMYILGGGSGLAK